MGEEITEVMESNESEFYVKRFVREKFVSSR